MFSKKKKRRFLQQLSRSLTVTSIVLFCMTAVWTVSPTYAADTVKLKDAVNEGAIKVDATSPGGYQNLIINLENTTNRDLSVDINGTYFSPPSGSDSQRMGVSHINGSDGDTTVDVDAGEETEVDVTGFCIDSQNGSPDYDEDYTFEGDVDELDDRPWLDDLLDWYADNPDADHYDLQDAIWSIETDNDYGSTHWDEEAGQILEDATGWENPGKAQEEVDEIKDDTIDTAILAGGSALASMLAAMGINVSAGGSGNPLEVLSNLGNALSSKSGDKELITNLNIDNQTDAIIGVSGDHLDFGEGDIQLDADGNQVLDDDGNPVKGPSKLATAWKHGTTGLSILNDANNLHQNGYNDNIIQSLGLSTMMNLGANEMMDALGGEYLGGLEAAVKTFLPQSCQDILPSNMTKQAIQAVGDVTKALAQSAGEGSWEPLNQYAQNVKDGKSGMMLEGYAELSGAAGEVVAAIENKGIVQTTKDFINDCGQIIEQGTWKDVIADGAQSLADEAMASKGGAKGIAELSDVAGHVVGTIESKGVVEGTKELAGNFIDDCKVIYEHGDANQIINDVGQSAQDATGIIGTGVAETSQLMGEYYEKGGGVIGGVKNFWGDCKLIWKYGW